MLPRRKHFILALIVAMGTYLFRPTGIGSPGHTLAQTTSDTKIVLLDVKPGLWEVHIHRSNTDLRYATGRAGMEQLTKNYTPEQRAKAMADYDARELKALADRKKGTDKTSNICPLRQDFVFNVLATGPTCSKQISSTGQAFNLHVACKAADGTPGYVQTNTFKRIDAENFQGTVELVSHTDAIGTITETYTGKWISGSCSGLPAGHAAKNGLHPKGPSDVARDDPNRIVAVFDGKQVTAAQAWGMIKKASAATRNGYKSGRSGLWSGSSCRTSLPEKL